MLHTDDSSAQNSGSQATDTALVETKRPSSAKDALIAAVHADAPTGVQELLNCPRPGTPYALSASNLTQSRLRPELVPVAESPKPLQPGDVIHLKDMRQTVSQGAGGLVVQHYRPDWHEQFNDDMNHFAQASQESSTDVQVFEKPWWQVLVDKREEKKQAERLHRQIHAGGLISLLRSFKSKHPETRSCRIEEEVDVNNEEAGEAAIRIIDSPEAEFPTVSKTKKKKKGSKRNKGSNEQRHHDEVPEKSQETIFACPLEPKRKTVGTPRASRILPAVPLLYERGIIKLPSPRKWNGKSSKGPDNDTSDGSADSLDSSLSLDTSTEPEVVTEAVQDAATSAESGREERINERIVCPSSTSNESSLDNVSPNDDTKVPIEGSLPSKTLEVNKTRAINTKPASASKSMTEMDLENVKSPSEDRSKALERLKKQDSPPSLEEARGRRLSERKERSNSIKFLRERTASRSTGSSSRPPSCTPSRPQSVIRANSNLSIQIPITVSPVPSMSVMYKGPDSGTKTESSPLEKFPDYDEKSLLSMSMLEVESGTPPGISEGRSPRRHSRLLSIVEEQGSMAPGSKSAAGATNNSTMNPLAANFVPAFLQEPPAQPSAPFISYDRQSPAQRGLVYGQAAFTPTYGVLHTGPGGYGSSQAGNYGVGFHSTAAKDLAVSIGPGAAKLDHGVLNASARRPVTQSPWSKPQQQIISHNGTSNGDKNPKAKVQPSQQENSPGKKNQDTRPAQRMTPSRTQTSSQAGPNAKEKAKHSYVSAPRATVNCAYCGKPCPDKDQATLLCHGCGPNSSIRYCSNRHLFLDIHEHWQVCSLLSTPHLNDYETMPRRFAAMYPAISNRYGWTSPEFHRQRAWSIYNHNTCDYALFEDWRQSQRAGFQVRGLVTPSHYISWEPGNPTKDLVNRLLNLAFYDHLLVRPLMFLYRIIRQALRLRGELTQIVEFELCHQFWMEFHINPAMMASRADPDLKTEWEGPNGLRQILEDAEARVARLRLWRRDHPDPEVRGDAWKRFKGFGFPMAQVNKREGLGAGWDGI
ncbi:MAG: hypothetical protein M1833_006687 [Piccolia ochrophora]|nr:MAG: hypothetical protein M1833_006687 [Piccolia ochrophora]